jgi:hypothetical protein
VDKNKVAQPQNRLSDWGPWVRQTTNQQTNKQRYIGIDFHVFHFSVICRPKDLVRY